MSRFSIPRPGWLLPSTLLALLPFTAVADSAENGKDVYGPCAACHGGHAEGGKGGEYPRLAGQPPEFIINTLKLYQARKRYNVAMFPYTEPRELTETDMKDVAAFITRIELPARAPDFKDTDSALDRLLAMERVLVVPRIQGDVEKGQALYRKNCQMCHAKDARGRKHIPGLVGQYPGYLQRQVDFFLAGTRPHDKKDQSKGSLNKVTAADITDILAWLTAIQDQVLPRDASPEPEPPPTE